MNAAEIFVKCLENEGVEYIFGLPGEENAHLIMALEESAIDFIMCRHEQGAAFMADVYGRLTGRPGVCLATLGPGATNLVTGVADGNMDRSPMVIITGQADSRRQHKESHQNMDVVGMFEPITKWAQAVIHPANIPEIVRKAFKLATTEKAGACHIELADDIAGLTVEGEPIPVKIPAQPVASDREIDKACALIEKAHHPIILVGNGCLRQGASGPLRDLAKTTGIGVVNTFMAKGAVDWDSPECLFTIGLQAHDHVLCALQRADLVICVGYDLVEYAPRLWSQHVSAKKNTLIHIDCQPAEIDDHYTVDLELIGHMGHTLQAINQKLASARLNFDLPAQANIRKAQLEDIMAHTRDTESPLKPQKILADVRAFLDPEDIVLSDVGAHKMWIARHYLCHEPNTCLISNGFCSMGFALPGAIGAKLVHPDRQILAICGDGGFLMNIQELETARRIGANIVVMVWEDGGYGLIKWKQINNFGAHSNLSFQNPDFNLLAQSFGCMGIRVETPAELPEALDQAFSADCPVILSMPVDYRENLKLSARLGQLSCPI